MENRNQIHPTGFVDCKMYVVREILTLVIRDTPTQRVINDSHCRQLHEAQVQNFNELGLLTIGIAPIILYEKEPQVYWILDGQHRMRVMRLYSDFYGPHQVPLVVYKMENRPPGLAFDKLFRDLHQQMPIDPYVRDLIGNVDIKTMIDVFKIYMETYYREVFSQDTRRRRLITFFRMDLLINDMSQLLSGFERRYPGAFRTTDITGRPVFGSDTLVQYFKWVNLEWKRLAELGPYHPDLREIVRRIDKDARYNLVFNRFYEDGADPQRVYYNAKYEPDEGNWFQDEEFWFRWFLDQIERARVQQIQQ